MEAPGRAAKETPKSTDSGYLGEEEEYSENILRYTDIVPQNDCL